MEIDILFATLRLNNGRCLVHIRTQQGQTVLRACLLPVPYDQRALGRLLTAIAAVFQCRIYAVISAGWLSQGGSDAPSWAEQSDWPEGTQVRVFLVGRDDGRLGLGSRCGRRRIP